LNSAQRN